MNFQISPEKNDLLYQITYIFVLQGLHISTHRFTFCHGGLSHKLLTAIRHNFNCYLEIIVFNFHPHIKNVKKSNFEMNF